MTKEINDRTSGRMQVSRRACIGHVDIVQVINECLRYVAADGGGACFERAGIMHDGKSEARVKRGLLHESLRCNGHKKENVRLILGHSLVDDGAIKPPADHVIYLFLHLCDVAGGVTHVHVVAKAEPRDEMRVNFGG